MPQLAKVKQEMAMGDAEDGQEDSILVELQG